MQKLVKLTLTLTLMLCLFWMGCTISNDNSSSAQTVKSSTTSTSTTIAVNPQDPSGDVVFDETLVSCVIYNLDVSVDSDTALITWDNPTSDAYSESELYLYEIYIPTDPCESYSGGS